MQSAYTKTANSTQNLSISLRPLDRFQYVIPLDPMDRFKRLIDTGLVLTKRLASHVHYGGGYNIQKPDELCGNTREGSAPSSIICEKDGEWIFEVHCYTPGPGPGDFTLSFPSLDSAIDSVLDYYFGDPIRMNPPNYVHRKKWNKLYRSVFGPRLIGSTTCCRLGCDAQTIAIDSPTRHSMARDPQTHYCETHLEELKRLSQRFLVDADSDSENESAG